MSQDLLEIATGQVRKTRRSHGAAKRRQIVAESYAPGASVSVVARRHDINANLLFTRRRQALRKGASLLPVQIAEGTPPPPSATTPQPCLEVDLASGHRVRVLGAMDMALVCKVLKALGQ
jgi:transposase